MKTQSGFTLVELIIVLVLIGILSSYVVIRSSDSDSLLLKAHADQFAQHLRHAQMLAMTWGRSLTMAISAGGYQVSCSVPSASSPCNSTPVIDPATGQLFSVSMTDNVSMLDSGTIEFDALGRPVQSGNLSSSVSQWRMSKSGFQNIVSVNPITGSITQ